MLLSKIVAGDAATAAAVVGGEDVADVDADGEEDDGQEVKKCFLRTN